MHPQQTTSPTHTERYSHILRERVRNLCMYTGNNAGRAMKHAELRNRTHITRIDVDDNGDGKTIRNA